MSEQHYIYIVNINFNDRAIRRLSTHRTRKGAVEFAENYMKLASTQYKFINAEKLDQLKTHDDERMVRWEMYGITLTAVRVEIKE